ncbi:MAG TPA: small ribosomal subunit Rsm22 family protein [Opitutus sp.]|nr:small ribosomal subunit Rsm22 family protein [Opitutus sp.]
MTWEELDWKALDRLRDGFLTGGAAQGAYWKNKSDLASYDFTFGERIGWKWDHVLRELRLRRWQPASRHVFDWGCGSGIASRRVIEFFGPTNFDTLTVWDHSPAACDFAAEAASQAFTQLHVTSATPGFLRSDEPIGLLVISHVLNELSPLDLATLRTLVGRAAEVIWVEPGTHEVSRALSGLRDAFLSTFRVVAPCTHQNRCPALAPGKERDWCHFFAPPPSEIFANPDWVKFGQRAGIDLRSLPYCFVALDRSSPEAARVLEEQPPINEPVIAEEGEAGTPLSPTLSRVIGRPEHFKPYARLLNCDASGLHELELLKRTDPALYKQLDRTKAPLVYRWRHDGAKILSGEPLT